MNSIKNIFTSKEYYYIDNNNELKIKSLNFLQLFLRNHFSCCGFYQETYSETLLNNISTLVLKEQFADKPTEIEKVLKVVKALSDKPNLLAFSRLPSSSDFILAAIKSNLGPRALEYASNSLKQDRGFFKTVLGLPNADVDVDLNLVFNFMDSSLKKDPDFMLYILQQKGSKALNIIDNSLWTQEFIFKVFELENIDHNEIVGHIPSDLKKDKKFLRSALKTTIPLNEIIEICKPAQNLEEFYLEVLTLRGPEALPLVPEEFWTRSNFFLAASRIKSIEISPNDEMALDFFRNQGIEVLAQLEIQKLRDPGAFICQIFKESSNLEVLNFVTPELRQDTYFFLNLLEKAQESISYSKEQVCAILDLMDENLRNNRNFIFTLLEHVKLEDLAPFISEELLNDRNFCLDLINLYEKLDITALLNLLKPKLTTSSIRVNLAPNLIQKIGLERLLPFLDQEGLLDSKWFIAHAVKQTNYEILQYSPTWNGNKQFIRSMHPNINKVKFAHVDLRNDPDFIFEVLCQLEKPIEDGLNLLNLSDPSLKENRDFFKNVAKKFERNVWHGWLAWVDEKLINNPSFLLEIAQSTRGQALKYVSDPAIQTDREFILQMFGIVGEALMPYISLELKDDDEFLLAVVQRLKDNNKPNPTGIFSNCYWIDEKNGNWKGYPQRRCSLLSNRQFINKVAAIDRRIYEYQQWSG